MAPFKLGLFKKHADDRAEKAASSQTEVGRQVWNAQTVAGQWPWDTRGDRDGCCQQMCGECRNDLSWTSSGPGQGTQLTLQSPNEEDAARQSPFACHLMTNPTMTWAPEWRKKVKRKSSVFSLKRPWTFDFASVFSACTCSRLWTCLFVEALRGFYCFSVTTSVLCTPGKIGRKVPETST